MDASVLMLLLRPDAGVPHDPSTGSPLEGASQRMALLISQLERARAHIVLPTPALSEILVHAGERGPTILDQLQKQSAFRISPFGTLAAVEVAARTRTAVEHGSKRGGQAGPWAKIKYDRQIVAIAAVERATIIYSDDEGVRAFAADCGIRAIATYELPLPTIDPKQLDLLVDQNDRPEDDIGAEARDGDR